MNEGVLFFIAMWLLFILASTQWLDGIWKDNHTRNRRLTIMMLLLMIMGQGLYLPITDTYHINMGVYIGGSLLLFYAFWARGANYRLQILCVMIFLGIFYAMSYKLFFIDPVLMIWSPLYLLPIFMTLFVALATSDIAYQWLMMGGGMLCGELLHQYLLQDYVPVVYAGDAYFRDMFIVAFSLVTAFHLVLRVSYRLYQLIRTRQPQGE
ncbi:hypothetical protein [Caldalkalibacillus salinus]|uniref:YphA family membrane protein n=1 Tax=Caldalkalibacillus salinus TaxID=2803787 RepID=UPI0019217A53|nr:hypothetical protein [Caldalkalibacillus salinus]